MKSSYYLVIPKQQDNPQRLRDFDTRALQQWINELPTANPGLATRLIHDFILEFNTVRMSAQLRLEALELLKPSLHVIEDHLIDRLIKTGFPKEENHFKILDVLVSIQKEFTIGYWTVLKEISQRSIGWFQGKNAALAIQRTIKGLSAVIISHFLMGMPLPDWIWIDLHSLYRLSVKIKKDTTKVDNEIFRKNKSSTPEECYRQILLLSLAYPNGLMQKEILLVYDFIETLANFVSLKKEPVSLQAAQCVILPDEDQAPFFQSDPSRLSDTSKFYLDLTLLYKELEQKEKLSRNNEGRFSANYGLTNNYELPPIELLEYLNQRWHGLDIQGDALFSDRLDRLMTIGLASTIDLQNSLIPQNILPVHSQQDQEFLVQSESDKSLSCIFKKTGVLSVGSMVSFRKTEKTDNHRLVGIVDKLEVTKQNNKLNFSIQLLTAQSLSITYLQLNALESAIPQKALFYTTNKPDEASYIITDKFILKEGDIIRVFVNQENFPVELKNKKNIGLGYWQFLCSRSPEPEAPAQPPKAYDFI